MLRTVIPHVKARGTRPYRNMNIFRFSRGDFYGIIIPGSFLAINIFMFVIVILHGGKGVEKIFDYLMGKDAGVGIAPFFIFFVASYVLGFGLRSFHPDMSEGIYRFFHLEKYKVWKYLVNIRLCKRGRLRREDKFSRIFKKDKFLIKDKYPYGRWFRKHYLPNQPESYRSFYRSILTSEFSGVIKPFKGDYFINLCKAISYGKCDSLRDEIIFCEGLVRFYSGIFLSLLLSSVIAIIIFVLSLFLSWSHHFLLSIFIFLVIAVYIFLAATFGKKLKSIRIREVQTIFNAFYFIKNFP